MLRRPMLPWLAFAALIVLFELPALLSPAPWRPSADPLLLASAWLIGARVRFGAWLRRAVVVLGTLLVLHRLDRIGFVAFMGEEPLLYDQLFLLRHLLVLIDDLWSARLALGLLAVLAVVVVAVVLVRRLLGALALPFSQPALRRTLAGGGLLWALVLGGTLLGEPPAVQWQSSILVDDILRSARIYAKVQRRIGASPYAHYASLKLTRKPDVHLFFVESYGRVVIEHPDMRARWLAKLQAFSNTLRAGGWHAVSGFSRAPISGGRSWLAEASVLTGMRVAYQAEYHHLLSQIARVPHLPRFLEGQGYSSVLLAPADRPRRGLVEMNPYGFDRVLRFRDLGYRGPKVGWGIVPDQYSLGVATERVLNPSPRPVFFDFHMVSSHAPWEQVPELVEDWRSLDEWHGPRPGRDRGSAWGDLKRFVRSTRSFARMGELRDDLAERYTTAVLYELSVLERHLAGLRRDALVIATGDHQPPFIAAQTQRFDTPVHVFARDPSLLQELRSRGFRDGLRLDPEQATTTAHEALFSLIVRGLSRCCARVRELPSHHANITLGSE